eukprot:Nitzschia sp. Nitz4//scaffold178_size73299//10038//12047//NITZ4_005692-RA/size73299-processed-gene-0.23-mRNA-1//-1//CDS//3329539101//6397//frame0
MPDARCWHYPASATTLRITMKLQLTVFAKDLKPSSDKASCSPFAIVAETHEEPDRKPTVLGRTETLKHTVDPDFTKIFVLSDFQLGKSMHILVTIRDENEGNENLGSALFDVGVVLGTKGGIYGKQLQSGGYIMVHVEPCSGKGTFNLELRGEDLVSKQSQVDPYLELQKKRETTSGESVWDVVYRSTPVENSTSPTWPEISVDFGTLCDGKKKSKFRISVKDYDESDDSLIGSCVVTAQQLMKAAQSGEAIMFKRPRPTRETGKMFVVAAAVDDSPEEEKEIVVEPDPVEDGEDEIIVEATDDIVILPDVPISRPTFADYVSGGCQLRVIVAIDYTASNGDPRKEQSLHHFSKEGMNTYESTMSRICNILSEYDSDKKFPVYGFGAKKNGELSQCFAVGDGGEVEGVDGVLKAYRQAFQTGLVMSKPTDVTEVIKMAGATARASLESAQQGENQEYTILTIFTNGGLHSVEETKAAIAETQNEPLSIVVIGVGSDSFTDMELVEQCQKEGSRVQFVDVKKHDESALSEVTLREIPEQLVAFFQSKDISPKAPIESDEIVIEPFNGENEVTADVTISDTGDIEVNTDAKPPEQESKPSMFATLSGKGQNMVMSQAKRQFGRVGKKMQRKINRLIDTNVNKMFR